MATSSHQTAKPYRPCVGLVVVNSAGLIFLGERSDNPGAWQMPQGGVDPGETPLEAAWRELYEETGIKNAALLGEYPDILRYDLPSDLQKRLWQGRFCGQEQSWFAMRYLGKDEEIDITREKEFCSWKWENPENILGQIVAFKRPLYQKVLAYFVPHLGPA